MELALSLGENTTTKPFSSSSSLFLGNPPPQKMAIDLGFSMDKIVNSREDEEEEEEEEESRPGSSPVQLELLPFSPVIRRRSSSYIQSQSSSAAAAAVVPPPNQLMSFSWLTQNLKVATEPGSSAGQGRGKVEVVNRTSSSSSSPPNSTNSAASSFKMDFLMYRNGSRSSNSTGSNKRNYLELQNTLIHNHEGGENFNASSRGGSDDQDDENGLTAAARKKLRLTKQQSAFLEESFKEHNTLNPKQKLALAKQLNLRPRQVEVWFQNRRARTKLKQTEVDCEHLKRCCEKLTEENRRLQKELQELRALKSSHPFYMQLPATTLTMCPSCERVVATTTANAAVANASPEASTADASTTLSLAKPRDQLLLPFPTAKLHQATKAAAS